MYLCQTWLIQSQRTDVVCGVVPGGPNATRWASSSESAARPLSTREEEGLAAVIAAVIRHTPARHGTSPLGRRTAFPDLGSRVAPQTQGWLKAGAAWGSAAGGGWGAAGGRPSVLGTMRLLCAWRLSLTRVLKSILRKRDFLKNF